MKWVLKDGRRVESREVFDRPTIWIVYDSRPGFVHYVGSAEGLMDHVSQDDMEEALVIEA